MPQTLPFSGAIMYDIFNADGLPKIGSALDDEMGTKVGSNVRIFDGLLQSQNNQIVSLQSQLTQLIQDNYTIYYVELTKDSAVTTSSSYAGNNNKFTALKEDYIYLLKFDSNSIGNIQININALGFVNVYKVSNGTLTVFQDDDIVANIPYLFLYKNGQFVFVGENDVQKLKELDTDIEMLQENITNTNTNLMAEITARDPQNKDADAFLASNHDMTGFSVPVTYTPIVGSDSTLSAIEKMAAQQNQQDTEISTLEQRVDSLYGALIFLGNVSENTVNITQAILTSRSEEILTERGMSTELKQGYTLVDLDSNDWWYDATNLLWVNIGYFTVATATNTTKGIVMGSVDTGKVSVETDGTMTVNGMVESIVQGTGISINNADPKNPVISKTILSLSPTLISASWAGSGPYTYSLNYSAFITSASLSGYIGLANSATLEQVQAAVAAKIRISSQTNGSITLTADGIKPTVNIPIIIQLGV